MVGGDRGTYSAAVVAGQAQGVRGIRRAQSERTTMQLVQRKYVFEVDDNY
jgi:hypothetical protein